MACMQVYTLVIVTTLLCSASPIGAYTPDDQWGKRLAATFNSFCMGLSKDLSTSILPSADCCFNGMCGGPEVFDSWKGFSKNAHTILTRLIYKEGFAKGHWSCKTGDNEWSEGEFMALIDDNGMVTRYMDWTSAVDDDSNEMVAFVPDLAWAKRFASNFDTNCIGDNSKILDSFLPSAKCCLTSACGGPEVFEAWRDASKESHTILTNVIYKRGLIKGHWSGLTYVDDYQDWFEGEFLALIDNAGMISHYFDWTAIPDATEIEKETLLRSIKNGTVHSNSEL